MTLDTDRITHPLRLAKGSHQPGSGKGCAMDVISYINGDTKITDYPACSARPLASLVQMCNDALAGPDGYLSPENSLVVLDLGWQTVGTSGVSDEVIHAWMAEVIVNPEWGVIRYAEGARVVAISNIAENAPRSALESVAESVAWYAGSSAGSYAGRDAAIVEFTRQAITCWRNLAGIDNGPGLPAEDLQKALIRINS